MISIVSLSLCIFPSPSLSSVLDPGPNGEGRYSERMFPVVKKDDFRKASQVWYYEFVLKWIKRLKIVHLLAEEQYSLH